MCAAAAGILAARKLIYVVSWAMRPNWDVQNACYALLEGGFSEKIDIIPNFKKSYLTSKNLHSHLAQNSNTNMHKALTEV